MKILFYDTKKYDKESFDKVLPKYEDIEIEYVDSDISVRNAVYAKGLEAVCGFVSSDFSAKVIDVLADNGVKIILLRCAGFNNVDIKRAKERGVLVMRVPGYSPDPLPVRQLLRSPPDPAEILPDVFRHVFRCPEDGGCGR